MIKLIACVNTIQEINHLSVMFSVHDSQGS